MLLVWFSLLSLNTRKPVLPATSRNGVGGSYWKRSRPGRCSQAWPTLLLPLGAVWRKRACKARTLFRYASTRAMSVRSCAVGTNGLACASAGAQGRANDRAAADSSRVRRFMPPM